MCVFVCVCVQNESTQYERAAWGGDSAASSGASEVKEMASLWRPATQKIDSIDTQHGSRLWIRAAMPNVSCFFTLVVVNAKSAQRKCAERKTASPAQERAATEACKPGAGASADGVTQRGHA